jgi:hypothetical protein
MIIREEMKVRYLKTFSACLIALALNSAAWGEIYETTDAEGNPEFTNSPPEANATSKVIEMQQTNVADAPQPQTQGQWQEQEQQPDAMTANQQPEKNNNTVIIDNPNANNVYDQARVKQQEFERMNPAAPHEVLNAEAPHQVGDFPSEMPSEVDDTTGQTEEVYNPAEHRTIHHRR